jgi:hypothetical protein
MPEMQTLVQVVIWMGFTPDIDSGNRANCILKWACKGVENSCCKDSAKEYKRAEGERAVGAFSWEYQWRMEKYVEMN